MSQFLDILKTRLTDSQQRLQAAQANLQRAQQEHQAVMQEFSSWQNAVVVETRREQGTGHLPTLNAPMPARVVASPQPQPPRPPQPPQAPQLPATLGSEREQGPEINKAAMIRDVLRQNPNGITPADLWRQVKDHVARPYVYSTLNRLKDKKKVSERRGKYYLVVTTKTEEESREQSAAIQ